MPLASGQFYLIWAVLFSSTRAVSLVVFPIFLGIGDEYSLSSSRFMPNSSSLTSTPSPSCPTFWGLLSLCAYLSLNIWLASLSCLLIFLNSFFYPSSTSPGPRSFHNFSDYFTAFFILPHHHFSTMVTLFKALSSLQSISFYSPIFQITLSPLLGHDSTPKSPHPKWGCLSCHLSQGNSQHPLLHQEYLNP